MTYDRHMLMYQPRPSTVYPTAAKTWEAAASSDGTTFHPVPIVGVASRNARCGEFTDVSKLPGVPGKDGDCILLTYRLQETDQYVKVQAVTLSGERSVESNVITLPETNVGVSFMLLTLALFLFIGTDPNRPKRG